MTVIGVVGLVAGGLFIFGWVVLLIDFACMSLSKHSLIEKLPEGATNLYGKLWYGSIGVLAIFLVAEILVRLASFEI